MGRPPVHVAWIFDDAVSLEASVAITSVVANADPGREYILHLVVLDVSPARLEAILKLRSPNIRIDVHPFHTISFQQYGFRYAVQMSLERLVLGRHLPDVSRVVYLDTDLVAHRDVAELYDIDLGGCPIGGAVDLHMGRQLVLGRAPGGGSDLRSYLEDTLSISGEMQRSYFNAGVLILDLDYMRAHKVDERVHDILASGTRLLMYDQCALNMLMLSRAKLVDGRWNVLVPSTRLSLLIKRTAPDRRRWRDLADPFILHFAGGKPWRHRSRPKASYWWAYAMASPLRKEIVSEFWTSRGRNSFSTIRSKAMAPVQMVAARRLLRDNRVDRLSHSV